ncbi:hypothetical protein EDB89DRAFT_1963848 [Lactarius sanguifluus]|nr:hypothetical protein EDB89DRAFT_1963848 [Lactarius sanguifluus]
MCKRVLKILVMIGRNVTGYFLLERSAAVSYLLSSLLMACMTCSLCQYLELQGTILKGSVNPNIPGTRIGHTSLQIAASIRLPYLLDES